MSGSLSACEARSQLSKLIGEMRSFLDKHSLRDALSNGTPFKGPH